MKRASASVTLVIALLAGIAVPLLWSGGRLLDGLRLLPLPALAAGLGLIVLSWGCNATRLALLTGGIGQPLSWWRSLGMVMATEFAICVTPGGTGGPVIFTQLGASRGLAATTALALYAFAQLSDLLVFTVALIGFAVSLQGLRNPVLASDQLWLVGPLLAVLLVLAVAALRHYRPVLILSGHALRGAGISLRWRRRLTRWSLQFRKGMTLLIRLPRWRLALVLLFCVLHWIARYSVLFLLLCALEVTIPWAYTYAAQMIALAAGAVIPLPGGSGGVELAMTLLLTPYLKPALAAAVVIGWRFATYHWYLIVGAPIFALMAGSALWRQLWRGPSAAASPGRGPEN